MIVMLHESFGQWWAKLVLYLGIAEMQKQTQDQDCTKLARLRPMSRYDGQDSCKKNTKTARVLQSCK